MEEKHTVSHTHTSTLYFACVWVCARTNERENLNQAAEQEKKAIYTASKMVAIDRPPTKEQKKKMVYICVCLELRQEKNEKKRKGEKKAVPILSLARE